MNQQCNELLNSLKSYMFVCRYSGRMRLFQSNLVKNNEEYVFSMFLYHYSGRRCLLPTQSHPNTLGCYEYLLIYSETGRCPMSSPKIVRTKESHKNSCCCRWELEVIQPFQIFHSACSPLTFLFVCPHMAFHLFSF